jgi:hypothetical protein
MNLPPEYTSPSGQLKLFLRSTEQIVEGQYGDLKAVTVEEYIYYIRKTGELIQQQNIGKLLLDFSQMKNLGLSLRAAAVNSLNELIFAKAPFFLLAIVKSKHAFDNVATQTALKLSKPLSKKFLDGKMFSTREEAVIWLNEFNTPRH